MGVCLSLYNNKDNSEVNINSLKSPNQKAGKRLKRIKTKFPKRDISDDDDEEEKDQVKKEDNKSKED